MSLDVFNKYPLVFNLNLNSYNDKDVKNLIDFCLDNFHIKLNYEEATKDLQKYKVENLAKQVYCEIV